MKTIIITLMVTLMSVVGLNAQNTMDKFEVQVDGLGCPFCAYGLEKKFKELKGIKKVKIEIETGDFSFEYPSEKALSIETVEKQVEKAGYTPITTIITRASGEVESSSANTASEQIVPESLTTGSVFIAGNCDMCKARIEKAASGIPGVNKAVWNKDTKILALGYDAGETSVEAVEKVIAEAGHDTKNFSAPADVYESLPGCCHYERVEQ